MSNISNMNSTVTVTAPGTSVNSAGTIYTTTVGTGPTNVLVGSVGHLSGTTYTSSSGWYSQTNFVLYNKSGQELVRITEDGEVVWTRTDLGEAEEALTRVIYLSAESKAGVTERVKQSIRNKIFEEIIRIAKIQGTLTAEELTLIYESTKIMEKLKGIG